MTDERIAELRLFQGRSCISTAVLRECLDEIERLRKIEAAVREMFADDDRGEDAFASASADVLRALLRNEEVGDDGR